MSDAALQFENLFQAILDPEYRYLLMEPLIFYGILFGVISFLASFFMRVERFQTIALILVALSALAYVPYIDARAEAQPRIEQVYKKTSSSRVETFRDNTVRWRENRWIFYALAGVAGATLLVGSRRNRLGMGLAFAAVVIGLVAAKEALWLHYQDSVAYHPHLTQHEVPFRSGTASRPQGQLPSSAAKASSPARDQATGTTAPATPRPEPSPIPRLVQPLAIRTESRVVPSAPVTKPNGRIPQPPPPGAPAQTKPNAPTTYQAPQPATALQPPRSHLR